MTTTATSLIATKITTFEEACQIKGIDPNNLPDVSLLPAEHRNSIIAYYKLVIIAEVLNEGWTPNWYDTDQVKYFAWFWVKATKKKPAGVGFSGTYYGYSGSHSDVGSRLCFYSRELALYFAKTFEPLFKAYLLAGQ